MSGACGSCTACCRVYAIPELDKPAGKWCQHCAVGVGCKIYDARPKLCVDFSCMWLHSHAAGHPMEDELRPDRCKVVFSPTVNSDMSSHETLYAAITMPGAPDAFRRGAAARLIEKLVKNGIAVVAGAPQSTTRTMITRDGEHDVHLSEPDELGMQWSIDT